MSNKVVFSNAELYEKVEPGTLASLIVEGYWDNPQYAEHAVDATGLSFKAVYDNYVIKTVDASMSPSTWSSSAGTKTATFSYTEGGTTKSATKDAKVFDNYVYITATDSDVLYGKKYLTSSGTYSYGTMPNRGGISGSIDGLTITSYTIPQGYHNGGGTVTISSNVENALNKVLTGENYTLASSPSAQNINSSGNADDGDILENKKFINSSGVLTYGAMDNVGAVSASIDGLTITSYTVQSGYHNGSGVVSLTDDIEDKLDEILDGPPAPNYVGGIVFYIDSTADGTYTFYNANGTQVSAPSVGTDCTGWTYEVTGASKDKYYVVYDELYTSKQWGGYGTSIGASGTAIGTGRSNTTTAIGSVADVSGSIWETIRNMRTNALGGCDDWFVGSHYELNALRTSGAGNSATWFSGNDIWTSSEASAQNARSWRHNTSAWYYTPKNTNLCVCGVRAF